MSHIAVNSVWYWDDYNGVWRCPVHTTCRESADMYAVSFRTAVPMSWVEVTLFNVKPTHRPIGARKESNHVK